MGALLAVDDLPGIDAVEAGELIDELESHLSLHYPAIFDLEDPERQTAKALLKPVVRRWHEAGTGLTTTITTGPFAERKSGGGGHVLWEQEITDLRKLCGMATGPARPRGSFPPPEPIADLFMRRPSWPRGE